MIEQFPADGTHQQSFSTFRKRRSTIDVEALPKVADYLSFIGDCPSNGVEFPV